MRRTAGIAVLGLSACGYPLTQCAVRRWGVRGAAVAEAVCAGLAIRDAPLLARRPAGQQPSVTEGAVDAARRVSVAMMFAVHTIRFGTYLCPGQGPSAGPAPAGCLVMPGCAGRWPQ
jgi:hypothetical protein